MGARPDATPLVRFGVGCLPPTSSAASDHRKPRQRHGGFGGAAHGFGARAAKKHFPSVSFGNYGYRLWVGGEGFSDNLPFVSCEGFEVPMCRENLG